ncbi:MAG TPA: SDR family oxidoreductase [Ktedonobacteraceae bacterium]|nr:SDR family oxidoreductase [Ktedonobacteraceae bacterium]
MALTEFTDTVAVITGGASGIGLATARALRAEGAHVVLVDIQTERLQEVAAELEQEQPGARGRITGIATNVTDAAQVQSLMNTVAIEFGRIDLVVNCAGIGRGGPIEDFSAAEMQNIMNINFMGTYHVVQAALPTMRKQQAGHFVLLSSVAGKLGVPGLSAYCATKWAVRGFSSAMRAELYGTGINITTVYPAWVDTPMIHQENELQHIEIQAFLTPKMVADEILQAVREDKSDLTLAPNQDISLLLQVTHADPDKAEQLAGQFYSEHLPTNAH